MLVRYPHSDLIQVSRRPALVVQSESVPTGLHQTLVALITSKVERKGPSRVPVAASTDMGKQMGLRTDSVVVCDNLATVLDREIDGVLGTAMICLA